MCHGFNELTGSLKKKINWYIFNVIFNIGWLKIKFDDLFWFEAIIIL